MKKRLFCVLKPHNIKKSLQKKVKEKKEEEFYLNGRYPLRARI